MPNILTAIKYLVENPIIEILEYYKSQTRVNSVGDALEKYIKDIFAETTDITNEAKRIELHSKVFSYFGNQNNPPDLMIRGGDAIEVKKIQSDSSSLALNSSYPKDKLYIDNPMLTDVCKNCEPWDVKDIMYVVGCVKSNLLKSLWIVYGDCYAASKNIYEKIRKRVVDGIEATEGLDFSETNELGRINKVDPLGITYFRIRGMWGIENPRKVFSYINPTDSNSTFQLTCLMRKEKFESFSDDDRNSVEDIISSNFNIKDVKIKNPDNPATLLDSKLITFKIS